MFLSSSTWTLTSAGKLPITFEPFLTFIVGISSTLTILAFLYLALTSSNNLFSTLSFEAKVSLYSASFFKVSSLKNLLDTESFKISSIVATSSFVSSSLLILSYNFLAVIYLLVVGNSILLSLFWTHTSAKFGSERRLSKFLILLSVAWKVTKFLISATVEISSISWFEILKNSNLLSFVKTDISLTLAPSGDM